MPARTLCGFCGGDKADLSRRNFNEGGFAPIDLANGFVSVAQQHGEKAALTSR
jgi:hypothetical protein